MSCADVCIAMDYDGSTEMYREATRRAAKAHKCCECGDEIKVGESHHYATGLTEGDFWSFRTCAPCHEIRVAFCCGGWLFTELWESINDQIFYAWNEMKAIDCLARLTTQPAIDKMRAKYAATEENR